MLSTLIGRNDDLRRLRDEGFELALSASNNHLVVRDVPYVAPTKEVKRGTLVMPLAMNGDTVAAPPDHVAYFAGDPPCHKDGMVIEAIRHSDSAQTLDKDLRVDRSFSAKPPEPFKNYYEKVLSYVTILEGPAQAISPDVTARTFPPYEQRDNESVFLYADTASSRAGISALGAKLELGKVAIVGLGGTGSYVLDLIAKTPIKEIHLFDRDVFSSHNAFRAPGAAPLDALRKRPHKVTYLQSIYTQMRRNIFAHEINIDSSNVGQLDAMEFVFLCMDGGPAKKAVVTALQAHGVSFVDAGMGIELVDGALLGLVATTTSTASKTDHVPSRVSFGDVRDDDDYGHNIQIAELNALNAALAVIKWKKLTGFYASALNEHFSVYTLAQNSLINEDVA